MLPTDHLLAFVVIAVVLILVPGPSVLFVVTRSLTLGPQAGLATVVGNAAGVYVQSGRSSRSRSTSSRRSSSSARHT